jgi:hypothetical protein
MPSSCLFPEHYPDKFIDSLLKKAPSQIENMSGCLDEKLEHDCIEKEKLSKKEDQLEQRLENNQYKNIHI